MPVIKLEPDTHHSVETMAENLKLLPDVSFDLLAHHMRAMHLQGQG